MIMNFIKDSGLIYEVETKKNFIIKRLVDEFYIKLSTSKNSIMSNGVDSTIITATYYNYLGEKQNYNETIIFVIDGVKQEVLAVDGIAEISFTSELKGVYVIKTDNDRVDNGLIEVIVE